MPTPLALKGFTPLAARASAPDRVVWTTRTGDTPLPPREVKVTPAPASMPRVMGPRPNVPVMDTACPLCECPPMFHGRDLAFRGFCRLCNCEGDC